MGLGWSSKPNSCMHAVTLLLVACFCSTVLSFEPDPAYYSTPHEAIEYAAWRALKEGKPPCVTVHPIGITLFCIMGQCVQHRNGSSYCQCRQHFAGLTCSIYKGKCTSETLCSPHLCKDNPNKISLYECVCKPGYHVPDSPAFSHCIPDNLLGSATREKEGRGAASAITLPSTMSAEKNSAEKISHLDISGSDTTTSISVFHEEKKASQLSAACETSDFHTSFTEPNEESKMEDSFFRQLHLRADTKVVLVLTASTVETKPSGSSALHDVENHQDSPTDEVKGRKNVKVEMKAGSVMNPYVSFDNASIVSQFIGQEIPRTLQHNSKRTTNVQVPTIRRRRASTFQREQDQAPENLLTLDDLTSYSAHSKRQEISKKINDNLISIFNPEQNMPTLIHATGKGDNSTEVVREPHQKEGDEDYEVSQFRRKLLNMAPVQLAKSGGHIGTSLQGSATYLMAAEMKRWLGGKKNAKHKQLPAEAQDDIIDSLKHAVETSENSKTNETDSEMRRGNILVVADKRRRRKSSILQSDHAAENNSTNQKLSLAHPLPASKNKKDISRPAELHRVIEALMQHSSKESHLPGATYRHDEDYYRKMRHLKYGAVPVMTWRKELQPNKVYYAVPSTSDTLNKSEWMNQNPWLEVKNRSLHSSKDCASTNCSRSSMLMSPVNYQTFNKKTQLFSEQSKRAAIKNSSKFSHMHSMSPALDIIKIEAPESSSEAYAKHKGPKHRRSFGRDPMLFFNVTVLSGDERNKSSASYLIPFAGNKAILISWGTYDDSL